MSTIMKWFGEDFGNTQAIQLKAIAPYLPDRSSYEAAIRNTVTISYLDYDWRLNEQPAGSSKRP
jgi:hypothetical protein